MGIQQQILQAGSLDAMTGREPAVERGACFARSLVPVGYACLAFDYQGFAASEGERGRLVPQEQVREVISAVIFLQSVSEIEVTPFEVLPDDVTAQTGVADVTMSELVREKS